MKHVRRLARCFPVLAVATLALMAFVPSSQAQGWPSRPIRMIVPFAPGPAVDLVARLVGPKMSDALGQPVVIENRAGANGIIGSEVVARAPADGYTILLTTPSTHVTSVFLMKSLPFDPVKDFTPIITAVEPVTALAVHPSVAANSVKELIDYARKNPGKLSYASSGVGSVFHMTGELLKQSTGIDILHVPYKGVVPALNGVVAGEVSMMFSALAGALPNQRAGKLKILAVLEANRAPRLPNVPTMGETIPGYVKPASWFGFFGPAGMARPVVARLNAEIAKGLNAPDVRARLDDVGYAVIADTPEQFAALIRNGFDIYGKIIKAAGIQPE